MKFSHFRDNNLLYLLIVITDIFHSNKNKSLELNDQIDIAKHSKAQSIGINLTINKRGGIKQKSIITRI